MSLFAKSLDVPEGSEEWRKLMQQFVMSGAAVRFTNEFCPALIDCGSLSGYDQDAVDGMIELCRALQK